MNSVSIQKGELFEYGFKTGVVTNITGDYVYVIFDGNEGDGKIELDSYLQSAYEVHSNEKI